MNNAAMFTVLEKKPFDQISSDEWDHGMSDFITGQTLVVDGGSVFN